MNGNIKECSMCIYNKNNYCIRKKDRINNEICMHYVDCVKNQSMNKLIKGIKLERIYGEVQYVE